MAGLLGALASVAAPWSSLCRSSAAGRQPQRAGRSSRAAADLLGELLLAKLDCLLSTPTIERPDIFYRYIQPPKKLDPAGCSAK